MYLGNFKKIILASVKKKWLVSDPFAEFKPKKDMVKKFTLSSDRLRQL